MTAETVVVEDPAVDETFPAGAFVVVDPLTDVEPAAVALLAAEVPDVALTVLELAAVVLLAAEVPVDDDEDRRPLCRNCLWRHHHQWFGQWLG